MLNWRRLTYAILHFLYVCLVTAEVSSQRLGIREDLDRTDKLELIVQAVSNTPPNFNDEFPTTIMCEMYVDSFDSINEADMDFTVTIFIHLKWKDERFRPWAPEGENASYIEFDSKQLNILWVPDLFFPNEKSASFHNVFMPNKMLRIYPGGTVSYTTRMSMTLACPMNLRNYPFDVQICSIEMESFSYDTSNILLDWVNSSSSPVQIKNIELPQFQVADQRLNSTMRSRTESDDSRKHSVLCTDFYLVRNIGYYIVQMYVPSILVVMLSWISFWLNVHAVPGRIALGILTVLTMTTQMSGVNESLPRVSYTKAIDIWMSTCLFFVFAAFIEFAVANVLSRNDNTKELKLRNIICKHIPFLKKKKNPTTEILVGDDGEMRLDPRSDPTLMEERNKMSGIIYAMYLDVASRFLFPFLFGLFNLIYWTNYMSTNHTFERHDLNG